MTTDIQRRYADRLRVLNEIYRVAAGSRQINVSGPWLLEHMDMPKTDLADACMYLVDEHLIEGDKPCGAKPFPIPSGSLIAA